eukprot:CAMPEP_0194298964 /NCGR_PEP_ID=MMETSP0169-20130528/60462_1 /TAXON_ID=218684 /ORGANISM="Corethron pennatum, Strain L29A3" /LENGTH=520 /DNA_ID=CAMNT_0039049017 /DNA_START=104 /DNA_END=1666 /DNA_ORIENTATION=-
MKKLFSLTFLSSTISNVSFIEATPTFTSDYFFGGPEKITRGGNPHAVIISPPINYSLGFTIEIKGKIAGWGNIIHITTGDNCCAYGQRVPLVAFKKNTTQLIVAAQDSERDGQYVLPNELALHQKHDIVVHVFGFEVSTYINGTLAKRKNIKTRMQLDQVNVWIGDPWHEPADAIISDLSFTEAVHITLTPTTAFQGEDYTFKNFESSFVDDGNGFAISLNYTLGKSVNRVNVTLLDKNCTSPTTDSIINLVTDKSEDSNVQFLKKVSVNKQKFSTSTLVTRSEGSSRGTLSFCVKAEGLSENNMSVSFQQDKLNLSYDLTNNYFEILANGLKSDDINTTLTSVTASYSIIAHRCNSSTYEAIDPATALQQNGLVFICIQPNSTDVEIYTFNLNFVQDEFTFQVVNLGEESSILSSVYTEGDKIKIVSRLISAFFNSDTDTFTASGNADLVFKTARRKLDSLRSLSDKDNAGQASFGMDVKLQKRIVTQKQFHNIPQIALSVLGTCVLLSVLSIAIKKLK